MKTLIILITGGILIFGCVGPGKDIRSGSIEDNSYANCVKVESGVNPFSPDYAGDPKSEKKIRAAERYCGQALNPFDPEMELFDLLYPYGVQ